MVDKAITEILRHKKQMMQNIAVKRGHICEDIKFLNKQIEDIGEKKGHSEHMGILEQKILRMQKTLDELEREECRILLVWETFYGMEHSMFELMNRLYVNQETWYTVESELHVSHEFVKSKRKEALNIIREVLEKEEARSSPDNP